MSSKHLIVTHHAPDLDAATSVWLLKRFASQDFADAIVQFVNPGETMSDQDILQLGVNPEWAVHVDTGCGKFDHHQKVVAAQRVCASSLVFDYICTLHPEAKNDTALKKLVEFTTEIDHFEEIYWPDAGNIRYAFMIHELIKGCEYSDLHDDNSQLQFAFACLDDAYATLVQEIKAEEIIKEKGVIFQIKSGKGLGIFTRNDDTIKIAQKQGFQVVIRKDSENGHIRIKVRPDAPFNLDVLHQKISDIDRIGTWFYHGSGKMLLNGSMKDRNQSPSPLTLNQVINLIKEIYG